MHLCVRVCVTHECSGVYAPMHAHAEARAGHQVSFSLTLHHITIRQVFSELEACHFNQANWPSSTWAPPVSTLPMLGPEVYAAILTAGNSNSGAHACRARTLHQAASQHWKLFVLEMYFTLSMCEYVCVCAMKFRSRCQVSLSWGCR